MVVWVLQRIYCCVIHNSKLLRMLYECYERSIMILYWTLIVTSGYMSIMKDLLLHETECKIVMKCLFKYYKRSIIVLYWMLNCHWIFIWVLRMIYSYDTVNVKLLWIAWMSITEDIYFTKINGEIFFCHQIIDSFTILFCKFINAFHSLVRHNLHRVM